MIKYINIIFYFFLFILTATFSFKRSAEEILIYADEITYDTKNNIIAKGNAKIISENKIILSDLIIYNQTSKEYTIPKEFSYKDEKNNYYYGSSGKFFANLNKALIEDIKLLLNDGSRIVGKSGIRDGEIDLITKGSYSPCTSRIKIKNFVCPIWQLEGEKIIHDSEKLFLYQKHAKMRILNLPVYYFPYLITPSPLRKERKSGFLSPKISLYFIDVKTTQSLSFPYYFNIDIDKELTFTPIINYGGGVDSSQRMLFDYNQVISGGDLTIDSSISTNLERQNNENWFKNGSLITTYKKNINENYNVNFTSALQTSRTYLRTSDPDNPISSDTSLSTIINLNGYGVREFNDRLLVNASTYQVVQGDEDNKTSPTTLPYITYNTGINKYNSIDYNNNFQFYNIFRESGTTDHAQKQKKISHYIATEKGYFYAKSKITLNTEIHSQYFETENKKIGNKDISSKYSKIFPMSSLSIKTPFRHIKTDILINPLLIAVINSSQSNSDRISNEESTNNTYDIINQNNLNRYTGTDKLDNSKRITYGFEITKDNIKLNFSQNYEFSKNSNYHFENGNKYYLSDALGSLNYGGEKNTLDYNTRYDPHLKGFKSHEITYTNTNRIGSTKLTYIDTKKESNNLLVDGDEILNYGFSTKKFKKYSEIHFSGSHDLQTNKQKEFSIGYSYIDECFGINLNLNRKNYTDAELKPEDNVTLMFSFKSLGSYASSNLAVSETDKQDIQWEAKAVEDEKFE